MHHVYVRTLSGSLHATAALPPRKIPRLAYSQNTTQGRRHSRSYTLSTTDKPLVQLGLKPRLFKKIF